MRRPHHVTAVTTALVTACATVLVTGVTALAVGPAASAAASAPSSASSVEPSGCAPTGPDVPEYCGELAGARYRVQVPDHWNGTLVLFSHGHYPSEFFGGFPVPHLLGNQELSAGMLTDHGYAVAASLFQGDGLDFTVPTAVADQSRLLDWFETHVAEPDRTITYGQSMGAVTAIKHAETEPERIDGVLTVGGALDWVGHLDTILDINAATRALLTDGTDGRGKPIELVEAVDGEASRDALVAALTAAQETPEGRARIALIASLGTVSGWYWMNEPEPRTPEDQARGQAQWLIGAAAEPVRRAGRAPVREPGGGARRAAGAGAADRHGAVAHPRAAGAEPGGGRPGPGLPRHLRGRHPADLRPRPGVHPVHAPARAPSLLVRGACRRARRRRTLGG